MQFLSRAQLEASREGLPTTCDSCTVKLLLMSGLAIDEFLARGGDGATLRKSWGATETTVVVGTASAIMPRKSRGLHSDRRYAAPVGSRCTWRHCRRRAICGPGVSRAVGAVDCPGAARNDVSTDWQRRSGHAFLQGAGRVHQHVGDGDPLDEHVRGNGVREADPGVCSLAGIPKRFTTNGASSLLEMWPPWPVGPSVSSGIPTSGERWAQLLATGFAIISTRQCSAATQASIYEGIVRCGSFRSGGTDERRQMTN